MQSKGDRIVEEAVNQAFGPQQPSPEQMQMAQAMMDPFAGLPVTPEPCKWDAQVATMPAHEEPVLDDEGNVRVNDDGSPMMEQVPAHHLSIVRFIYPNHLSKVWLDRDSIKKLKNFLTSVDDLLREHETGLTTSTARSKLYVPGQ